MLTSKLWRYGSATDNQINSRHLRKHFVEIPHQDLAGKTCVA
ncbi:MAG: hypothetical protein P5702_10955 [Limnospira sp. PMC 1291.21]|uniref:Uncharacterized protein n=2 Tax=Limnospira TaxID=2596745 RepID=A0A9P1P1K0_9CYAN|nr:MULTISPECIES: hypothetical protein [Limnospira]EKD08570.1 hypothetical protein SPLC1_S220170 [Arthrospira platensis C1]MDC0839756.1 hypothetical protein [Limnoraphis robusta]MDY7053736.1 hypothetical protein [Limnospira fusiformis LS22]MDT9178046.1 hypothetical protein [Limnospira sp. PMC 1238.20]MDT9187375.1 hypothetical protein [Limnospira sp. PMC 894.15]